MGRKVIAIWLCLTMLLGCIVIVDVTMDFTIEVKGATLYVNTTGSGGVYTKIQDAINDSKDGDTVYVYNGTYYENVLVNKTINLIGENSINTTIDCKNMGDVIRIDVDLVNVTGFTLTNGSYGIYIDSSSNNNSIKNNNITENAFGIGVYSSSNNTIKNNMISNHMNNGITLVSSSYNNISNNDIKNSSRGIALSPSSNNNLITSNNITNNSIIGIRVYTSIFINISGNNLSLNKKGIYFDNTIYSDIIGNIIDSNRLDGISLWRSSFINTIENNISNNGYDPSTQAVGLNIYASSEINIQNNYFTSNGVILWGQQVNHFNSHNIPTNNLVNGKPLYYFKNSDGLDLDGILAGQIILANCTNSNVSNIKINNTDVGIELALCTNTNLTNSNFSYNNDYGIYINAFNNTIYNNTFIFNKRHGLYLREARNNYIIDNQVKSNIFYGFRFSNSHNNYILGNIILNNYHGLYLSDSNENNFTKNTLYTNGENGFFVDRSDRNNFINNDISNHELGIFLYESSENVVIGNNISNSTDTGLLVGFLSENNIIYHNNFINNSNQSLDNINSDDVWDNGYPSGGNYWSDYQGNDSFKGPNQNIPGSDGIGDSPYIISTNTQDNYPLIAPYLPLENFTILKPGWNLISIPLIQIERNLTRVLGSIDGWYDAVQWYDITDPNNSWKHHKVGKSIGNNLFELNESMGFWVHITQPGDTIFLYNGTQPTSNQTIPLHPGWNMVGYPSNTSYNRTSGLNNLTFDTHVDAIWTYNASTQKYKQLTASDYFEIGKGYYIHAKEECTWKVPL